MPRTPAGRSRRPEPRVRDAEARVADLEGEQRRASRALDRAKAPLAAYWQQVGAGDRDPDGVEEARLIAAVRDTEAVVTLRPTSDGRLEVLDDRVEAMLAGARQALDQLKADVEQLVVERIDDLAGGLTAEALTAHERLQAALEQAVTAREPYARVRQGWRELYALAGMPCTLPADPLRGLTDELPADGLPVPIPTDLTNPTDESEEDTQP